MASVRWGPQDSEHTEPFIERISRMEYGDDPELREPKLGRSSRTELWRYCNLTKLAFVWVVLLIAIMILYLLSNSTILKQAEESTLPEHEPEVVHGGPVSGPVVLLSTNATATFRENLVPSVKYVTTFVTAGFTNQFMETASLIYLSILTKRVPVVPAFLAEHFGKATDIIPTPFSDIFDLPYLSGKLGIPIVEWHELKRTVYSTAGGPRPETEKLGCWSTAAGYKSSGPTYSYSSALYGLDISYTPVPSTFSLTHGSDPNTYMWSIWGLASLGFAKSRMRVLPDQFRKAFPLQSDPNQKLEPDETMLCWDSLYYTGVFEVYPSEDFFNDYSPYWSQVAVHMRWRQHLVELASEYLRRHFGINNKADSIPPFISVHIRRSDFEGGCGKDVTKDQCFAPIEAYERRVQEVRDRLVARANSINVREVLVTSDEQDPRWWERISALGPEWRWIDHAAEQTGEKYGKWFPLLLDMIFQSMGKGFVGTSRSTMSELARVRVEDWNDGESATVLWGFPGADNH
ncbi:GDP-fucose protein O-fucosyltransferase [Rhizoctonia solani]|uniref:GDP-fucose protein O-fucosyltransferase 2 n=1 Tax=Rhizoctonia solani TaxID=456999 RepID=A0A8H7LJH6_9AGAM